MRKPRGVIAILEGGPETPFASMTEAIDKTGIDRQRIVKACAGGGTVQRRDSAKVWSFRWAEGEADKAQGRGIFAPVKEAAAKAQKPGKVAKPAKGKRSALAAVAVTGDTLPEAREGLVRESIERLIAALESKVARLRQCLEVLDG